MLSDQIKKWTFHAAQWLAGVWNKYVCAIGRHRMMWLLLWVISLLSIADIPVSVEFGMPRWLQIVYILCVGAFKGSVVFILCLLCYRRRWLKVLMFVAVGAYAVAAFVNFASYILFGFGITRRMLSIIMQTNMAEAMEFFSYAGNILATALLSRQFLFEVIAAVVAITLISLIPRKIFRVSVAAASCAGLLMAVVFAATFSSGRSAHLLSVRLLKYGRETYKDLRNFENLKGELAPLPDAATVRSSHRVATVVVVIGESALRGHWQEYGYPLPTTPRISAMADSLFIFNDVIGSSTATSLNLANILTLSHDDSPEGAALTSPRLIDIFNHAGYSTYWLSNQERTGLVSNLSGVLASNAGTIRYIGAESSEDALITKYDEELLPYLQEALSDKAQYKLIFIHLLGSHVVYTSRYPDSFSVFSGDDVKRMTGRKSLSDDQAATIAEYDNSIRYTDHVLGRVIQEVADQTEPAALLYVSDHGVNVYDRDGMHGRGERFVEVPGVVYLNAACRAKNPEMVSAVSAAVNLPITTADMAHPLMTLTGTTYSGYDRTRDFLSPGYVVRHRYVDLKPWQYEHSGR